MARRGWGRVRTRRGHPTRRLRGAFLLLILIAMSCTSSLSLERPLIAPGTTPEIAHSPLSEEQRASLSYVFYEHNPMPPQPGPRELARLERDLEAAPPVEVEELRRLFDKDLELLAYATRDSDGDGVLDFRISEYHGKFFEGDIDLDGDGVRNVYDAAPYDSNSGGSDGDGDGVPEPGTYDDRDGDRIPDHLDWSKPKSPALAAIQTGLFRDFDVILVERNARFTPAMVQAADDALRLVFREPMASLRTIAVEDQLLLDPDNGDNGFMLGQTQTLSIYADSLEDASDLAVLGLFVHELGHAWQLDQDFEADALSAENKKMHFPPGQFTAELARYGWHVDRRSLGEGYAHALYWPHFYATSPRYLYQDVAPSKWAEWFRETKREHGEDFLDSTAVVSRGMVGPYAMTSPWEWHADHLMASIYNRMDRHLAQQGGGTAAQTSALLRARMLRSVQSQWSRYDYRNAGGTAVDRELGERFPMTEGELDALVERYVIPMADFPMLSEVITREAEVFSRDAQVLAQAPSWMSINELFAKPGAPGAEPCPAGEEEPEDALEAEPEDAPAAELEGALVAEPEGAGAPALDDSLGKALELQEPSPAGRPESEPPSSAAPESDDSSQV